MTAPKGRWNPEVAKVIRECIGNSLYCHNAGHPESVQLEDTRTHKIIFDGTAKEARAFIRARNEKAAP